MKRLLELLRCERGMTTFEWLVLVAVGAALSVACVKVLLPAAQNAHNTVVNRVTNLAGSGF